jgi:transposase
LRLWVHADRRARGQERSQAARGDLKARVDELERENAELRVERDVLKRSVVLWVKEATGGR